MTDTHIKHELLLEIWNMMTEHNVSFPEAKDFVKGCYLDNPRISMLVESL
jgi:hypothetical protein